MGLLEELAVRCEAAKAPQDAIDLAIAWWCYSNGTVADINYDPELFVQHYGWEPTRSVDHAIELIPENTLWSIGYDIEGAFARLCIPIGIGYLGGEQPTVFAANTALALTAASLRARHVMAKGSDV